MIQDILLGLCAVLFVVLVLLLGSIYFDEKDWKDR